MWLLISKFVPFAGADQGCGGGAVTRWNLLMGMSVR